MKNHKDDYFYEIELSRAEVFDDVNTAIATQGKAPSASVETLCMIATIAISDIESASEAVKAAEEYLKYMTGKEWKVNHLYRYNGCPANRVDCSRF